MKSEMRQVTNCDHRITTCTEYLGLATGVVLVLPIRTEKVSS